MPKEIPLKIVHDVFGGLTGYLMAYAFLIERSVRGVNILAVSEGK